MWSVILFSFHLNRFGSDRVTNIQSFQIFKKLERKQLFYLTFFLSFTSFVRKWYLTNHKFLHTGLKPYQCVTCGKKFPDKLQLHNHSKIHTDIFKFTCGFCPKKFRTRNKLQVSTKTIDLSFHLSVQKLKFVSLF